MSTGTENLEFTLIFIVKLYLLSYAAAYATISSINGAHIGFIVTRSILYIGIVFLDFILWFENMFSISCF